MTNNKPRPLNNDEKRVSARILITDKEAYEMVVSYVAGKAKGREASKEDVLIGKTKYTLLEGGIARTNNPRGVVELEEVKLEIKEGIEKIVMMYSE